MKKRFLAIALPAITASLVLGTGLSMFMFDEANLDINKGVSNIIPTTISTPGIKNNSAKISLANTNYKLDYSNNPASDKTIPILKINLNQDTSSFKGSEFPLGLGVTQSSYLTRQGATGDYNGQLIDGAETYWGNHPESFASNTINKDTSWPIMNKAAKLAGWKLNADGTTNDDDRNTFPVTALLLQKENTNNNNQQDLYKAMMVEDSFVTLKYSSPLMQYIEPTVIENSDSRFLPFKNDAGEYIGNCGPWVTNDGRIAQYSGDIGPSAAHRAFYKHNNDLYVTTSIGHGVDAAVKSDSSLKQYFTGISNEPALTDESVLDSDYLPHTSSTILNSSNFLTYANQLAASSVDGVGGMTGRYNGTETYGNGGSFVVNQLVPDVLTYTQKQPTVSYNEWVDKSAAYNFTHTEGTNQADTFTKSQTAETRTLSYNVEYDPVASSGAQLAGNIKLDWYVAFNTRSADHKYSYWIECPFGGESVTGGNGHWIEGGNNPIKDTYYEAFDYFFNKYCSDTASSSLDTNKLLPVLLTHLPSCPARPADNITMSSVAFYGDLLQRYTAENIPGSSDGGKTGRWMNAHVCWIQLAWPAGSSTVTSGTTRLGRCSLVNGSASSGTIAKYNTDPATSFTKLKDALYNWCIDDAVNRRSGTGYSGISSVNTFPTTNGTYQVSYTLPNVIGGWTNNASTRYTQYKCPYCNTTSGLKTNYQTTAMTASEKDNAYNASKYTLYKAATTPQIQAAQVTASTNTYNHLKNHIQKSTDDDQKSHTDNSAKRNVVWNAYNTGPNTPYTSAGVTYQQKKPHVNEVITLSDYIAKINNSNYTDFTDYWKPSQEPAITSSVTSLTTDQNGEPNTDPQDLVSQYNSMTSNANTYKDVKLKYKYVPHTISYPESDRLSNKYNEILQDNTKIHDSYDDIDKPLYNTSGMAATRAGGTQKLIEYGVKHLNNGVTESDIANGHQIEYESTQRGFDEVTKARLLGYDKPTTGKWGEGNTREGEEDKEYATPKSTSEVDSFLSPVSLPLKTGLTQAQLNRVQEIADKYSNNLMNVELESVDVAYGIHDNFHADATQIIEEYNGTTRTEAEAKAAAEDLLNPNNINSVLPPNTTDTNPETGNPYTAQELSLKSMPYTGSFWQQYKNWRQRLSQGSATLPTFRVYPFTGTVKNPYNYSN